MTLVGTFGLLLVVFSVPAFSAPSVTTHVNNITQPAYNITRNDNVRIAVLDLRRYRLKRSYSLLCMLHDPPQKAPYQY